MSPVIFGCVICGYPTHTHKTSVEASWLKEFRIIYSSPDGTFISGVGRHDELGDSTWIAPSDPAIRWDDQDYVFQADDEIPVMWQQPENHRHGFVLHDACWCLLQKALEPDKIPLERLLVICRSLPFPLRGIGVCWGHNYGGLTAFDNQDHYPWEDRLIVQYSDSEAHQNAVKNPYNIPEIPELLKMRLEQAPHFFAIASTEDCFSTLPWEILEAIVINLPTRDVLNLRRASKAFSPTLTSQIFWGTRFKPGYERDYVFEKPKKEPRDWSTLYRRTIYSRSPPGLKNRRRVWGLIQTLIGLLRLRLDERSEYLPSPSNTGGLKWSEVAADVKQIRSSGRGGFFNEGCRLLQKHCASIPDDLSKIAFSIVATGDVTYIAGMRLVTSDNADICLGYLAEGIELFLEVTAVKGFILAVGARGIHAIQVINVNGHTSKWFGCPTKSPVTERLAGCRPVSALEVGFDGYKMISLATAEPNLLYMPRLGARSPSLRATALWYPTIPSPNVCLNDESFTGECPSTAGYQPFFWALFGGPGGIYLRSLTEVIVTRLGGLCSIEFHYNMKEVPVKTCKLGRRNFTAFSRVTRFSIDGPGGEVIQTVDVSIERKTGEFVYDFYKHGKLSSFQITTNHGRSIHFQNDLKSTNNPPLIPLSIPPGTTLTGFYASQHPEAGLTSLGLMSEAIEQE